MVKFGDLKCAPRLEKDREPLPYGIVMTISRVSFSEKTKFGTIAKIDATVDGKFHKYRSTSKVVIQNLRDMLDEVKYISQKDKDANDIWYVFSEPVEDIEVQQRETTQEREKVGADGQIHIVDEPVYYPVLVPLGTPSK